MERSGLRMLLMKYVLDTGALLSLGQSTYFELLLKEYTFFTTEEVLKEIIDIAQYNDTLGKSGQIILKNKKFIHIANPQKMLSIPIDNAELSVFSLGKEKNYSILTDDIHAARVAKEKESLESKPSFILLFLLSKKKKITKEELQKDVEQILFLRNWSSGVLHEYAKKLLKEM